LTERDETADQPQQPQLNVERREESRWDSGHCDQVTVVNHSGAPLDWSVTLAIEGTLTQHWNAQRSGDRGEVRFEGLSWNDVFAPEASASFGYCASH
jgi:endoglucanase